MADVDELDPLGAAAVVDREQVAAREREQVADAAGSASVRATSLPPWTGPGAAPSGVAPARAVSSVVAIGLLAYGAAPGHGLAGENPAIIVHAVRINSLPRGLERP